MAIKAGGALALLLLVAPPGPAGADGVDSSFLESITHAPFIFEGEVVNVAYKSSRPSADGRPGLAHTFVTYRVDAVYYGSVAPVPRDRDGSTPDDLLFTLRFMGGVDGEDTFSLFSGMPLFDVGDHDLLMVHGNGELICPLAGCRRGRFRIIDGLIYNDDGQEVVATEHDPVRYGAPRYPVEAMTHWMGPMKLELVHVDAPGEDGPATGPAMGVQYDAEGFRAFLEQALDQLGAAGLLEPPVPVRSIDIADDFDAAVASPVRVPPPGHDTPTPADSGFLLADRLEQIFMRRNGDNPVLDPDVARALQRLRVNEMRRLAREEHRKTGGGDVR